MRWAVEIRGRLWCRTIDPVRPSIENDDTMVKLRITSVDHDTSAVSKHSAADKAWVVDEAVRRHRVPNSALAELGDRYRAHQGLRRRVLPRDPLRCDGRIPPSEVICDEEFDTHHDIDANTAQHCCGP